MTSLWVDETIKFVKEMVEVWGGREVGGGGEVERGSEQDCVLGGWFFLSRVVPSSSVPSFVKSVPKCRSEEWRARGEGVNVFGSTLSSFSMG